MRLFMAVPLPPEVERATVETMRRLKAANWPVRWVGEDGLHVTLKFFGEVTSDRIDVLAELLERATREMMPVAMSLTGLGCFPNTARPRVLYLEAEADTGLELLQDRIERGADGLGFPPEGRPFRPHVTLGRVREGHRLPSGWHDVAAELAPVAPFLVDRVVLFESELGDGAPRYQPRAEARLL